MGAILFRRLIRYLRQNAARFLGMMILTALITTLITSLVVISDTVMTGRNDEDGLECADDGQFVLMIPISDEKIKELSDAYGATIQKLYSYDITTDGGVTLRIFKNRTLVDKASLHRGALPANKGEIVIDQLFASKNGIELSNTYTAKGITLTVCGDGCLPDYERLIQSSVGFSANFDVFTWAIVGDDDYDLIKKELGGNETYAYAFTLDDTNVMRDFRRAVVGLEFNYKTYAADNEYFDAYLKDSISQIADVDALSDALDRLTDGSGKLHTALDTLTANNNELSNATAEIGSAVDALQKASVELSLSNDTVTGGAESISSAISSAVQTIEGSMPYVDTAKAYIDDAYAMLGLYEIPEELQAAYDELTEAYQTVQSICTTLEQLYTQAKELDAKAKEFSDGVKLYTEAQGQISASLSELSAGYGKLGSAINDYLSATANIADSAADLDGAINDFKQYIEDEIEKQINESVTNAVSFTLATDNVRMGSILKFAHLYYNASIAVGCVMIALLALIFSIITTHQINGEAQTIGALYALGVRKGTMMTFYMLPPVIATFIGSMIGLGVTYLPFMLQLTSSSFRMSLTFPYYETTVPIALLILAVAVPVLINLAVNFLVLKKAFARTALSLLQGNIETIRTRNIALRGKSFIKKFQFRQLMRELRIAIVIIIAILLAMMLVMIGINSQLLISNAQKLTNENTRYEYSYILRYPMSDLDCGGERIYQKTLRAKTYNTFVSIVLIGLPQNSHYYDAHPEQSQNTAVISSAVATKLGLGVGDYILLNDKMTERNYAFCVNEIAETGASLEVYIDIDAMREIFNVSDTYYNTLVSDTPLNIDANLIDTSMTKNDIIRAFDFQLQTMNTFIRLTLVAASIVYLTVLYLVVSMMIERNKRGISLTRILGYRMSEIRKMYIYCVMYTVTAALLIAIPVSKLSIDAVSPIIFTQMAIGQFYNLDFIYYLLIFAVSFLFLMCLVHAVILKLKKIGFAYALRAKQ